MRVSFTTAVVFAALLISPASAETTGTSLNEPAEPVELPSFHEQPKYCLFFTVDGLDRDYITSTATPNLFAWQKSGSNLADAINVYPTLTTPNMTSILTGAFPLTTTIGSNQVFLKDEKKVVAAPRFNRAKTIAEVFKEGGHSTAAVQHFMLENRGADRYHHTGTKNSYDVTSAALAFIPDLEHVPTLMTVLYQTVDGTGHAHGQDSREVLEEARLVDGEIGKIVQHYANLGILQDTLIVISSDHGMSSTETPINRQELNSAITSGGWTYQMLLSQTKPSEDVDLHIILLGNLQCYFNRDFSPEEQERLFQAISQVEGVGRIYDSMALRRMGAHPNAGDFIVEPGFGWWLGGRGGTHARNRESDGYQFMMGAGIAADEVVNGARTVDLVPTVLKAFNLPIPASVDGKILPGVLK